MSDFYVRMGNLAIEKILQYGKPITLTQNTLSALWVRALNPITRVYNWTNSQTGEIVTVEPVARTVTQGYGLQDRYKGLPIPGLVIQVGDIRLWAVGRDMRTPFPEPKVGDLITMNGKTKSIVSANPLQPGDIVLMWDIQLR